MFGLTSRLNKLSLSYNRFPPASSHSISSSSPASARLTVEQQLGIKPKPKRPPTTFLKFTQEFIRPDLLRQNPNYSVTQITKIAAERWKVADENLKKRLDEEFQRDMEQYRVALESYNEELSKVDKDKLRQHRLDTRTKKEKMAIKKQKAELGCPKKPLTSFFLYLQKRKAEMPHVTNHKEFVSNVSEEWKTLDPNEKAKYQEMQAAQKANYEKMLASWEREMRESGNAHLLSPKKSAPTKRPKSQ